LPSLHQFQLTPVLATSSSCLDFFLTLQDSLTLAI
jgi:hypothetical protein